VGLGVVHGLQLVAVAVVAQAIVTMRRTLAPDLPRMALAVVAAVIVFFHLGTLLAIAVGAVAGVLLLPRARPPQARATALRVPRAASLVAGALFVLLLFGMPLVSALAREHREAHPAAAQAVEVAEGFYRAGALVFGGGHVVLPLLERAVVKPGWVDEANFLSGYGAAQAVPGPLFTFAAYLGASVQPATHPVVISAVALLSIFAPGLLILVALLPYWGQLREHPRTYAALRGINAAVLGILLSAWIRPVCSTAIHSVFDGVVAATALLLLLRWKLAPWMVVAAVAALSAAYACLRMG
jgi:chromate transporter